MGHLCIHFNFNGPDAGRVESGRSCAGGVLLCCNNVDSGCGADGNIPAGREFIKKNLRKCARSRADVLLL